MARYTIQSKEGDLRFFMPDNGGYVRLENDVRIGTLADQICQGGSVGYGSTLTATPETFEAV